MARGTDTKETENKHSSRPVGGAETGTVVERTRVAVGLRQAECETNGAGSPSTSRPLHIRAQINRDEWRGAKQTAQPRAPAQGK